MAKKERLIELLQEKRTALITRAVTKGLDPNVPMKDSGVEWLGEIPAHWEIGALRRAVSFLTDYEANGSFAATKESVVLDVGEPFAWYVRATDLENERHGFALENRYCDELSYRFLAKTKLLGGELLVTKRGEIGKSYVMPHIRIPATLAPNLYLIRLTEKLAPRFAHLWFESSYGRAELILADKSTTIGALYKDDVKDVLIPFPPRDEQDAIVSAIETSIREIEDLASKVHNAIDRLKELRTALISAAVTGKIDVREEVGMSPEVSERSFEATIEDALLQGGPNGQAQWATAVHETPPPYGEYIAGGLPEAPAGGLRPLALPDPARRD